MHTLHSQDISRLRGGLTYNRDVLMLLIPAEHGLPGETSGKTVDVPFPCRELCAGRFDRAWTVSRIRKLRLPHGAAGRSLVSGAW